MRSLAFNRPRATALLLAVMFIFADMALPQTMEGWKMLEDEQSPERAVSTHAIHADSYISENNPTNSYNTSATGMLSNEMLQESRLLLSRQLAKTPLQLPSYFWPAFGVMSE